MGHLFDPLKLRGITFRNRIGLAPMCMYSARNGVPNEFHLVHYGSRAAGGCGLVLTEATAVDPRGMISPADTGLWNDTQVKAWRPVCESIKAFGAVPGVQLGHAGRKASVNAPWGQDVPLPGRLKLDPVSSTSQPFSEKTRQPHELGADEVAAQLEHWESAARRAFSAGFQVLEIHMAHGYLLHQFLSPLVNKRDDEFGGSLDKRLKFPLMVVQAVRLQWPEDLPLLVRISATDWNDDGWTLGDSVELSRRMKDLGVDLVDCSSGGATMDAGNFPVAKDGSIEPGYQVHLAAGVRKEAGIAAAAVGLITEAHQANEIVESEQADMVLLGREMLRHPHWPLYAAHQLGKEAEYPPQYERAKVG